MEESNKNKKHMKTKYIVSAVLVAGVLLTTSSVMAKENWLMGLIRGEKEVKTVRTSPKGTPSPANVACIATTVSVRESALGSAINIYNSTVSGAYSTRASALATAYTKSSTTDIHAAVKNAWAVFTRTTKEASKVWKTAQRNAWSTFKTAAKACKDSSGVSDGDSSVKEVSGQ